MPPNTSNSFITYIKHHIAWSMIGAVAFVSIVWMAFTGTLSYPYIMVDRQIESIRECTFGTTHFVTDTYGFSFTVPEGYCSLPNRLFPRDGSIEIVKKGWYFVINEYAKGTVAKGSQATLLFEPIVHDRDPGIIIQNLVNGRFLDMKNVSTMTNARGIEFTIAQNALGTDDELYDWAFATHPNKQYFVAIVTKHNTDASVLKSLLETLTTK